MRYTKSLKGSVNFKRVLKQGKFISGKIVAVYVRKNNLQCENNLLGICVSKKHGNSVTRNKLKRWGREGYLLVEEKICKNYDIVILYRKNIDVDKLNFSIVKDEIRGLFVKIGLLHESNGKMS